MKVPVFSCSLHEDSRAFRMARQATRALKKVETKSELIDLRETPILLEDPPDARKRKSVRAVMDVIEQSPAVILSVPLHEFDTNAATKNLIEITGDVWKNKVVGLLCSVGRQTGYMGVSSLATTLLLKHGCFVSPRIVFAVGEDFPRERMVTDRLGEQILATCTQTVRLAAAINVSGKSKKVRTRVRYSEGEH